MSNYVYARTSMVGYHQWPDAPRHRGYLGARHRHDFGIEVGVKVTHDDRDVEFHDLIDWIRELWVEECGPQSCERIAARLGQQLSDTKRVQVAWVRVDEDGQSGAIVRWDE